MGNIKKYDSQEEAKDAQKKQIEQSNNKTKLREKLFTKYASTQQKELIKTIKTVYIPMAKCEEMMSMIMCDPSIKMMTEIMIEKEKKLNPDSNITLDENTPLSDDTANVPTEKPKSKRGKPKKAPKSPPPKNEALLEDIEKLFQKYLIPFEDGHDF
jgi:hypothetical protein